LWAGHLSLEFEKVFPQKNPFGKDIQFSQAIDAEKALMLAKSHPIKMAICELGMGLAGKGNFRIPQYPLEKEKVITGKVKI